MLQNEKKMSLLAEDYSTRPMEQNRESRNRLNIHGQWIFDNV